MPEFFAVTVALGTTAPLGSVTVPVMSPETRDCATSDGVIIKATTSKASIAVINFLAVIISPLRPSHFAMRNVCEWLESIQLCGQQGEKNIAWQNALTLTSNDATAMPFATRRDRSRKSKPVNAKRANVAKSPLPQLRFLTDSQRGISGFVEFNARSCEKPILMRR